MGVSVKLGMSAVNLTEFFSVIEESERLGDSDSTGVAPRFSVPREGFLILGWRNTYGTHWFDRERVGEGISAFSNERKGEGSMIWWVGPA